jgi:asparagine synthase (glutamine-hydrolysing)
MCGIAGFAGSLNPSLLREMARRLAHRGPDDEGFYLDEGVGLAARRLAIIDLEGGRQPMTNEDGTLWLVFNGEIYNYRELRAELQARGHRLATSSDTEVILHLYEDEGVECLDRLRGMFAFALWDLREQKLLLARDRIGIKPLYYLIRGGKLLFASELKALLAWDGWDREIDEDALLSYLTFLYVPTPSTIFKGVRKLEPGHTLVFRHGSATLRPYWDLRFPEPGARDEREWVDECRVLLKETVERHLESDVPVGIFLSGGMDSSSLVALMARVAGRRVQSFTLGFEEADFTESGYARQVAERFDTLHHEFVVKPDAMAILPRLIWHLDEPCADASMVLTYLVSKAAREHVKVALSGIGGDELFGGYPRYLGVKLLPYYERVPAPFRAALARLVQAIPESMASTNVPGRIKRFIRSGLLPPDRRYLSWVSFFSGDLLSGLLSRDRSAALASWDPDRAHLGHLQGQNGADPLNAILYLDIKTYLADDLLMLADKMSMASSLELRVPFCDHRLLEFIASVPADVRMKGFRLKSLLKEAMAPLLPRAVLDRPKRGFTPPLARWLQGPLREQALDLLSEERIRKRGYFRPEAVRWLLERHFSGKQNLFDQIFALLVIELWFQTFLDKGGSP